MAQQITEEDVRSKVRALLKEAHPDKVDQFTFRGKQFDHGLAWVHFPEGLGGLGVSPKLPAVVADELRPHAQTTPEDMMINPIRIRMGPPTRPTPRPPRMEKSPFRPVFN